MGYAIPRETHRITLSDYDGSDNWVEIKGGRTGGDAEYLLVASENGRLQLRAYSAQLERAIVAWSLKAEDADPEPLPLSRETFEDVLPFELLAWLGNTVTAYYDSRRPSGEALKNSAGRSRAPSR